MSVPRKWLINIRNNENLTQNEVADSIGISRAYVTSIETGTRQPSVKVAKRIAKLLNFEWTIFFDSLSNESTPSESDQKVTQ
jgi:transcriptional regulator with XRE-family HTH domain